MQSKMGKQKVASINIRRRYLGDQEAGLPHSNDPEETMRVELWVGVTSSRQGPVRWIPMKRGPEGREAKGRGLDQGISSSVKPEPPTFFLIP
jgi:hypothetical protein